MKKNVWLMGVLLFITGFTMAQPGSEHKPPKPPTPEEHLKKVSEKLDKELHLTAAQKETVLAAYKAFFADIEKERVKEGKPATPPPPPPPPVKREVAEKLSGERDAKIKQVLTEEQFQKYNEIEKTMRPKRPC
ncbi:hypothetical protein [Parasediminibacterium sp. JCM 36343]|uniref:hypothetical protein n=1 Tax=Parasediminibacterium sp. JCM 36343 TaxID=3374279 RepID=UPI00397A790E